MRITDYNRCSLREDARRDCHFSTEQLESTFGGRFSIMILLTIIGGIENQNRPMTTPKNNSNNLNSIHIK